MMNLDEKELLVYDFIKKRLEDGFAPTVREICKEFNYKSTSTAHRRIASLTEKGYLEKGSNQNRAIRLAGKGSIRVPVIGTVTCGQPITAIQDITGYVSFYPMKHYDNEIFCLKVKGDSMINVGIFDGDYVICEKQSTAFNGEIVAAMINNEEATVKRFFKEKDRIRLQPENDHMDPIYATNVLIIGKVIAVQRYL